MIRVPRITGLPPQIAGLISIRSIYGFYSAEWPNCPGGLPDLFPAIPALMEAVGKQLKNEHKNARVPGFVRPGDGLGIIKVR